MGVVGLGVVGFGVVGFGVPVVPAGATVYVRRTVAYISMEDGERRGEEDGAGSVRLTWNLMPLVQWGPHLKNQGPPVAGTVQVEVPVVGWEVEVEPSEGNCEAVSGFGSGVTAP